jgi:hypothetical protein
MLRGGIKTSHDEDGATNCGRKRKRKPGFVARHGTKLPEIFPADVTTPRCAKRSANH